LQVLDLKILYKELAIDLVFFTKKIISYYDRYCNIKPTLKKKDKVYLIQRNIQTKQLNTKLDHKKLGLFKIKRITGLINYELVLPKTINIVVGSTLKHTQRAGVYWRLGYRERESTQGTKISGKKLD
jgi:hypothetical protein